MSFIEDFADFLREGSMTVGGFLVSRGDKGEITITTQSSDYGESLPRQSEKEAERPSRLYSRRNAKKK